MSSLRGSGPRVRDSGPGPGSKEKLILSCETGGAQGVYEIELEERYAGGAFEGEAPRERAADGRWWWTGSQRNRREYLFGLRRSPTLDADAFAKVRRQAQQEMRMQQLRQIARIGVKAFWLGSG